MFNDKDSRTLADVERDLKWIGKSLEKMAKILEKGEFHCEGEFTIVDEDGEDDDEDGFGGL